MRASNSHVDLGSSSIERGDASFTMRNDVWRNGTPEYAAPEMLTRDVPGVAELRRSPSVDVYALCSVLYEMYSGRTPFDVASSPLASPYALKTEGEPAPLEPACPEDEPLVEAITAGIHARQEEREDAAELLGRLHAWRRGEKYEPDRAPEPSEFARAVAKGTHLSMEGKPAAGVAGAGRPAGAVSAAASAGGAGAPGVAHANKPQAKGNIVLSRRALLAGVGAVALAGVGYAAWRTHCFGLTRPRALDDYSWDELAEVADKIAAAGSDEEGLRIVVEAGLADADGKLTAENVKRFELTDGTPAEAQIVGFRADVRADGAGKAGISLLMRTPMAMRPMNDAPATGG